MSIILFFAVLFVLILVHEWGHFIVAKKTGMRVDEFGIGMPPRLYGVKKGETEYTLNALPIGGFVRIWGENLEERVNDGNDDDSSVKEDRSRAFSSRPKWAQALVLVAGVTMNILFAWFLFTLSYVIGVPTAIEESNATDAAELYVYGVLPDSPGSAMEAGSIITSVSQGDKIVESPAPSDFTNFVTEVAPLPVTISYEFGDETGEIELQPVQGLIVSDPDRYAVGISLSLIQLEKRAFGAAIVDGFHSTVAGFTGIAVGLGDLISRMFVGEADFTQVAGPIGIVGMVGEAASFGITALLTFTAIISLNLAVINLLQFPALDGGRLMFVLIEAVTRKEIPPVWAGRLNLAGFALLMIIMILVTYNDIARLF